MALNWWAEDGEAWVAAESGAILWHGTVVGPSVLDAFGVPDSDDGIALLDWSRRPPGVLEWHPYPNLVRLGPSGDVLWVADPPEGDDLGCWTGAEFREGQLIGHTWSWACDLDSTTGVITETRWTK